MNTCYPPIPNLTDEQAISLSMRTDLPSDVHSQVVGHMAYLQEKFYDGNPKSND